MQESQNWPSVYPLVLWNLKSWQISPRKNRSDLTIIGMDDPLVGGVVDEFEKRGLAVFGPRKNAAILEGSKAFSKDLMKKYHIPTAAYENFDDPKKHWIIFAHAAKFPIVLKADGLALGKGVLICQDLQEAEDGVNEIMEDKKFGERRQYHGDRRIHDRT